VLAPERCVAVPRERQGISFRRLPTYTRNEYPGATLQGRLPATPHFVKTREVRHPTRCLSPRQFFNPNPLSPVEMGVTEHHEKLQVPHVDSSSGSSVLWHALARHVECVRSRNHAHMYQRRQTVRTHWYHDNSTHIHQNTTQCINLAIFGSTIRASEVPVAGGITCQEIQSCR